jgi:ABC-2 type transport system permease protein
VGFPTVTTTPVTLDADSGPAIFPRSSFPSARKFVRLLLASWQDALQYRLEGAVWFLYDLLPPLGMLLLWLGAYRPGDTVAGYDVAGMVQYYLGVIALRTLLNPHPEWDIAEKIAKGTYGQILLRPMSIVGYHLAGEVAWKVVRLFWLLPSMCICIAMFWEYLQAPVVPPLHWLAFVLSIPLGYLTAFFLKMTMGYVAFWATNTEGIFVFMISLEMVFTGNFLPLQAMPDWVRMIGDWLPYRYFYFFSTQILRGTFTEVELASGLLTQLAWVIGGYFMMRIVRTAGIRRYAAFGG